MHIITIFIMYDSFSLALSNEQASAVMRPGSMLEAAETLTLPQTQTQTQIGLRPIYPFMNLATAVQ